MAHFFRGICYGDTPPGDSSGFGVLKRLPDFWRHVFRKKLKLKQAAAAGFGRRVRAMRGPAGRGVAHQATAPLRLLRRTTILRWLDRWA